MNRPKSFTMHRKHAPGDTENLMVALAALVHRAGQITLSASELEEFKGGIGLRARYEDDGSMTLWTYDTVEDLRRITGR